MARIDQMRRAFLGAVMASGATLATRGVFGDELGKPRDQLQEPVFRVGKAPVNTPAGARPAEAAGHALDPALEIAENGLKHIQKDIVDYTCTMVKRERIAGKLLDEEYIYAKIRNRKLDGDKVKTPLAIYMYFLKPEETKGREVLFVEGENGGKICAHEGSGLIGKLPSVWLLPNSPLAMKNNRYPITEAGIENLVVRLLEKGNRDRKRDECQVEFRKNAQINKRKCTVLRVIHPVEREYFDFHIAEVFIDDEYNVPVRYAAYTWPTAPGEKPVLQEEYTYMQLKLNVGLTATDFDHKNPDYGFVRRNKA